ncbi:MAG: hypothetical protein AVDCRST_MAG73-1344, partial [uncultured Thermomicrobiales bacterium]
ESHPRRRRPRRPSLPDRSSGAPVPRSRGGDSASRPRRRDPPTGTGLSTPTVPLSQRRPRRSNARHRCQPPRKPPTAL